VIYSTGTPFNYSVISEREGERRVVDTYRKQSKKVYYKILRDKLSRMSDDKNEREKEIEKVSERRENARGMENFFRVFRCTKKSTKSATRVCTFGYDLFSRNNPRARVRPRASKLQSSKIATSLNINATSSSRFIVISSLTVRSSLMIST